MGFCRHKDQTIKSLTRDIACLHVLKILVTITLCFKLCSFIMTIMVIFITWIQIPMWARESSEFCSEHSEGKLEVVGSWRCRAGKAILNLKLWCFPLHHKSCISILLNLGMLVQNFWGKIPFLSAIWILLSSETSYEYMRTANPTCPPGPSWTGLSTTWSRVRCLCS